MAKSYARHAAVAGPTPQWKPQVGHSPLMRMGTRWLWLAPALVTTGVFLTACSGGAPQGPAASPRTATSSTASLGGHGPGAGATGVVADCTGPPPVTLEVRPSSIIVACADANLGAKDLTWSAWTSTAAKASGVVYENDCTPDCAQGVFKDYPASITLSDVRSTPDGPAFTVLRASYRDARPNGSATDTFRLEAPAR